MGFMIVFLGLYQDLITVLYMRYKCTLPLERILIVDFEFPQSLFGNGYVSLQNNEGIRKRKASGRMIAAL